MGKRILVSSLMVLLALALAFTGSTLFFSARYDALTQRTAAEQAQQAELPDALPAQAPAAAVTELPQETPETSETAETAEENPDVLAQAPSTDPAEILTRMTLEEKICQLLMVTPEALTGQESVTGFNNDAMDALEQYPVGGLIFFGANLETRDQATAMLSAIREKAQTLTVPGLLLGLDEEGGSVSRATPLGVTAYEDMRVYGEAGDTEAAYQIGLTLGSQLKELGFNLDFAPVADVLTNEENTVVSDRSFGSDPELVASMVAMEIAGFEEAGILSAPKHFPGHGSTSGDTHDGLAVTDRTIEELRECDFLPFQSAIEAGVPMIMMGHMTMSALDEDAPASMSQEIVTGLLRDELGYDGIIITDSVGMGAIADLYTSPEAVVQALVAGCDMVLCPTNLPAVVDAVQSAITSGTLSEDRIDQSVRRVLEAKVRYGVIS